MGHPGFALRLGIKINDKVKAADGGVRPTLVLIRLHGRGRRAYTSG